MASDWGKAGEHLVKHANGTYYARAKAGGKIIRKSLKTRDLRIAKIKRDEEMKAIRARAAAKGRGTVKGPSTIRDGLAALEAVVGEVVERSRGGTAAIGKRS